MPCSILNTFNRSVTVVIFPFQIEFYTFSIFNEIKYYRLKCWLGANQQKSFESHIKKFDLSQRLFFRFTLFQLRSYCWSSSKFVQQTMQIRRWNKRQFFGLAGGLLVFYLIFSASRNSYESDVIVKNVKPEVVWEYVADFHKMRLLNPTM